MASANEALSANEVVSMDAEEIRHTSKELDIDPDDIEFPKMMHHATVQAKLEALADRGVLTYTEVEEVYDRWMERRQSD